MIRAVGVAWICALTVACSHPTKSRAPPTGAVVETAAWPAVSPVILLARGESVYWRGAYDSATALWTTGLAGAKAARDSATSARLLTWLGLAAWRVGDYPRARRQGAAGLALKHRLTPPPDLFTSYNALGLLAWNEGRLLDALAFDDSAAHSAQTAGDSLALAKARGNRGLVQVELGAFDQARQDFATMRAGAAAAGEHRLEGNALTNLGMLDIRVGDPARAVHELGEALRHYRTVGFPVGEENVVGQMGTAYAAMGDFDAAFAALDSALALAHAHHLREAEASDVEVLAQLHATIGNPQRALALYREAEGINRALDLRIEQGADLRSAAAIYADLGQRSVARRYVDSALTIHTAVGATFELLQDRLARVALGDPAREAADLQSARALATRMGTPTLRADVSLTAARRSLASGQPRDALRELATVGDALADHDEVVWQRDDLRGQAYAALGDGRDAAIAGRAAVDAIERTRQGIRSDMLAASYTVSRAAVYDRLITTLVRLGRVGEAFAVSDAMRGRALLGYASRALATATQADTGLAGVSRLRRQADALEEELASLERDTASQRRGEPAYVRGALAAARAAYNRAIEAPLDGAFAGLSPADPGATAEAARTGLAPGEAIVEYVVGEHQLDCFVLSSRGIQHVARSVPAAELTARVRLARDLMGTAHDTTHRASPVLRALYADLVTPLREAHLLEGAHRLILVPQGGLFYLPFAALQDPRTGRYLVEDFVLEEAPSAAVAIVARRADRHGWAGVRPGPAPAVAFAPFPDALPASRAEAEAVGRLLPGADVVLGAAATEHRVRQALATATVVHLATHGAMNPANPLFSRLELSPEHTPNASRADDSDDGALDVREILTLRINHSLVFLSGCETGLGPAWSTRFAPGEDYATLAGAFLFAGARAVVGTLWPVPDDAAAVVARGFYQRLGGQDPAEALAGIQRQLIRAGQAPYVWAGYDVLGT